MTLDFNETCIVNQMLTANDRNSFLQDLCECRENTKETEICESLDSLMQKIDNLEEAEFKRLWEDRMNQKIFTYPPYSL